MIRTVSRRLKSPDVLLGRLRKLLVNDPRAVLENIVANQEVLLVNDETILSALIEINEAALAALAGREKDLKTLVDVYVKDRQIDKARRALEDSSYLGCTNRQQIATLLASVPLPPSEAATIIRIQSPQAVAA